jgi:Ca2+-binding RTX toxin-like protein
LGGDDVLYGSNANEVFVPGRGNNTVYARAAFDGVGKKTFVWNSGDGNITVNYDNPARVPGDGLAILRFGPGVSPEDVSFYNSGNNVVAQITQDNRTAKITLNNANIVNIRCQMDKIQFADGTVWEWSEVGKRKVLFGTEGNDILRTYGLSGETITVYGLGGDDVLYGSNANEVFVPGRGNNTVWSRAGFEGTGKKTFVWDPGDGNIIVNYDNPARVPGDGLAILRFGAGVSPEDVMFYNSGNHVIAQITLDGITAKITLNNATQIP